VKQSLRVRRAQRSLTNLVGMLFRTLQSASESPLTLCHPIPTSREPSACPVCFVDKWLVTYTHSSTASTSMPKSNEMNICVFSTTTTTTSYLLPVNECSIAIEAQYFKLRKASLRPRGGCCLLLLFAAHRFSFSSLLFIYSSL